MSFLPQQVEALKAPLARSHVRTRRQAGRDLSYIEGWHAISEANRIFGFDGWDRETVDLRILGEPREVQEKFRVAYAAKVRVTVYAGDRRIVREGTGYGSGIDRDLGSAHESAIKEAETDAMKRALMTFGNPFGLALYDKDQLSVEDDAASKPEGHKTQAEAQTKTVSPERVKKAWAWAEEQAMLIRAMGDSAKFDAWHSKHMKDIAALKEVSPEAHERLLSEIDQCLARFNPLAA